jgi:UDP-glucose 4-epimerase
MPTKNMIDDHFTSTQVVVTGGLGFIGSNLAHRLVAAGATVTLVDSMVPTQGANMFNVHGIRDRLHVVEGDAGDTELMRPIISRADYLFNLAGRNSHLDSMTHPFDDLAGNVTTQLALLEVCRAVNPAIGIVFASTRQVYGKPDALPVAETHPVRPVDINGIHKVAGEQYHALYHRVYGLRATVLRLTNTYGPRMRIKDARQIFLGTWVRQILNGEPVTVFGSGEQLRDFTYVDDCVEAMLLAATAPVAVGKLYNLGGDEVVSLRELAERMIKLGQGGTWRTMPFPADRKSIDIGDYQADYSLIEQELGWEPTIGLEEGLRRTLRWFSEFGQHYLGANR